MNVICMVQLFESGQDFGSERHFYFCRHMARCGHTVTAITSNVNYKKAEVKYSDQGWRVHREIEGVDVYYVYSYAAFRGSYTKRIWYYMTFFVAALAAGLCVKKPDVIYAVSTPLTVGLLGYLLSRIRRAPFVFEVTDVWPDAAVAIGVVKNRWLIHVAHLLEMLSYNRAARIIALTAGIRENIIGKGIPAEKVVLIPNGVARSLFYTPRAPDTDRSRLRQELGFGNHFVCMYLGAHGIYNALWTIVDAAEALHHDPRYLCVLVGAGDDKARLEAAVRERGLDNIRFLSPVPRAQAPAVLRTADLFLLPNRLGAFYEMNLPNKLFDFLAAGRPVIVGGQGESATLVRRAGAGSVVPAENGQAMAEAIVKLARLADVERAAMGEAGRQYVLEHYDRENLSRVFLDILNNIVSAAQKK